MRKRSNRLWIVRGFKGVPLRDTLATTAKEAKIRCVNALWSDQPDCEHNNVRWPEVQKWGWRCVRVTLIYDR